MKQLFCKENLYKIAFFEAGQAFSIFLSWYFWFRRQPTPPVKEPEPEPEADEQEDNQDLQNKVQKLEEEMQQVSRHRVSPYS